MTSDIHRIAQEQAMEATTLLHLPADKYFHFPWAGLDGLVGGIPFGHVWFVGGFSGNGKTTLLMSLLDRMQRAGQRVYYLGLETPGNELRTLWACLRLDIHPGDVLTGEFLKWPNAIAVRSALKAEIESHTTTYESEQIFIAPEREITVGRIADAFEEASNLESDVLIIDHIDHIEGGDGSNLYAESVSVVKTVLRKAQEYGVRVLAATQFNNDAVRGDPLGVYRPPQPQHVFMGGHKRHVASGMLGLFRPLRSDISEAELKAVKMGTTEAWRLLEPNTMGIVAMKHRHYGQRERHVCKLAVHRGRVEEMEVAERLSHEAVEHGIRTNRSL